MEKKIIRTVQSYYKHAAYRSRLIVEKYKTEYMNIYTKYEAYIGDNSKMSHEQRWLLED